MDLAGYGGDGSEDVPDLEEAALMGYRKGKEGRKVAWDSCRTICCVESVFWNLDPASRYHRP